MIRFKISVVMAVYNVERFLREAVESLVQQDIGFENIQLILVDDGSKDSSGMICDEYAAKYPENVLALHKENGGVATARNYGLQYAEGEYLNFMDSDDKFLPDALGKMYDFFKLHEDETDIVTLPLHFFDAANWEHWQNDKFKQGSRVIDLNEEPETMLMFVNASLFSRKLKDLISFDPSLPCGEDIKMIYTLLAKKQTLGVVSGSFYMYRRRSEGEASLVQTSRLKKSWYFEYFDNLVFWLVNYYKEKFGIIPAYIHKLMATELQWRFSGSETNSLVEKGILTKEEFERYKEILRTALMYVDDNFLMGVQHLHSERKLFMMSMKYGGNVRLVQDNKNRDLLICSQSDMLLGHVNSWLFEIQQISLKKEELIIEGRVSLPEIGAGEYSLQAECGKEVYPVEWYGTPLSTELFGQSILSKRAYHVRIPLDENLDCAQISFTLNCDKGSAKLTNWRMGSLCPIGREVTHEYYCNEGWMIHLYWNSIMVKPATKENVKSRKQLFIKDLRNKHSKASKKALIARPIVEGLRKIIKEPIWLISDRYNKADDNGEALFRYIQAQENHPKTYFIIRKDSPDYQRMKQYGPVVDALSWKHKILFLLASANISSQGDMIYINPLDGQSVYYRDLIQKPKYVFLQHGITKNDVSKWFNRLNLGMDRFCAAAIPEYESILQQKNYYLDEKNVKLVGFPRHDLRRDDQTQKVITIMPTWRRYLVNRTAADEGIWHLCSGFEKSEYCQFYKGLFENQKLLDAAEKYGYKIQVKPHPNMEEAVEYWKNNEKIKFCDLSSSYTTLYEQSALIVTDYSSAATDFAYMRKPLLYCQFDYENFYSGDHICVPKEDTQKSEDFGEVEYTLEGVVDKIIEYIENDCQLKPVYRERMDQFFAFNDHNNSKRVYEMLLELENEN